MKWLLPGNAILNTISVKIIEDILPEEQTNQEPDEEEEEIEHEAITQKPTCNKATEHLNVLCLVERISEEPQQIWKTLWDTENYILQQTEKNYKQSRMDNFFKKL
jgi:hypothetical protein